MSPLVWDGSMMSALMERDLWCSTRTHGRQPSRSRSWSTGPRSLRNSDADDDGNYTRVVGNSHRVTVLRQPNYHVTGRIVGHPESIEVDVKLPTSRTGFNSWFAEALFRNIA